MKSWIRQHPIGAYLAILYPVSWLFNVPALLGKTGLGIISVDIPWQPGVLAMSVFGLTGLAFVVTAIADGRRGVRELARHFYHVRVAPQWYLLAFSLPFALLLIVAVASHGTATFAPWAAHAPQLLVGYVQSVIVGALIISLCEEGGWTGFVTARLQRRWGPLATCFAVGPLMGAIHFPLLFMVGTVTVGNTRVHFQDAPLILFVLLIGYAIPFRIIMTWLYNSTGGSIPIVALTHQAFDALASVVILSTLLAGTDSVWLDIVPGPVALAIVLFTRGRLGYHDSAPRVTMPVVEAVPASA
ncbi:MAG TPA: CPBP family glutamic-type intramembrane protease [Candidatus Dormibacteraeota bacterium]|nr:CPBP family glutamic-type intramembrane protease [Candidatus Dormibacteraeota bacterium]